MIQAQRRLFNIAALNLRRRPHENRDLRPKSPRSVRLLQIEEAPLHYAPLISALAQLVEQLTVNQRVAGSSPAGGAIFPQVNQRVSDPLGPLARSFLGDW